LIEAAADVIAERGFHAASLMEVATRAGLTTGAVYSNFRSKEDLFLAVIEELSPRFDPGPQVSQPWKRLTEAAIQATRGMDAPGTRRVFKLQLELALAALGNPELIRRVAEGIRMERQEVASLLPDRMRVPRPRFRPTHEQLATAVVASLQGLTQHRFVDAEAVPEELAAWVVQALLHVASNE
jgi:AcrR family transcriptional regulator